MNLVTRFQLTRLVTRLKSGSIPDGEAAMIIDRMVQLGPDTIPALLDALSHGLARPVALKALERLLTPHTEPLYFEALASSNPAVLSGIEKLLSGSKSFDPCILLDLLGRQDINRPAVEHILSAHSERISGRKLLETLSSGGKDVQGITLRLLEQSCTDAAVPDLIRQLDSPHWHVRMHVLRILGRFPEPRVIDVVTTLLQDENQEVRRQAIKTLDRAEARKAASAIIPLLRDGNIKTQSAAIDALSRLGTAETVPKLLDVLKDESEYVRRAAVEVLNAIATTDAIQDLVRALRDADWWVRVRAADALGTLGGERVVAAVTALLDEEDEFLRRYAVEILITVPSELAVEPLIQSLDDPDWWVRERCIDALGETRDRRAVRPLLELIKTAPKLTALCARALGRLGDPSVTNTLVALSEHEDEEIARNARDGLAAIQSIKKRKGVSSRVPMALTRNEEHIPNQAENPGLAKSGPPDRAQAPPLPVAGRHGRETTPRETRITPIQAAARPPRLLDYRDLEKGTQLLERYTVLEHVGSGGFGVVYLVNDSAVREDIILKILSPQLSQEGKGLHRFKRELKLSRRVTHRNVIRIYDFMDLGGAFAVSMEYFSGRDLGKIIDRDGSIHWKRSLHIAAQICSGLASAHREGVIHRDIKPPNILVNENDEVKIVDFGLAAMEHQGGSRITKTGLLVGTPEYIAPEQISDRSVDHRADLYAVGVMLYEMISGEPPFTGETPVKILFKHMEGEAHPLDDLVPDLPRAIYDLVERAMAREPNDRPVDAAEMEAMCLAILNREAA